MEPNDNNSPNSNDNIDLVEQFDPILVRNQEEPSDLDDRDTQAQGAPSLPTEQTAFSDMDKDVVMNPLYKVEPNIPFLGLDSPVEPEEEIESESESDEEREIIQVCPRVNCPEKIIICLDLSKEMELILFRSRAGDKFTALSVVKRAINIFLYTKARLDSRHEYALAFLQDQALWMHNFTNDPEEMALILDGVNSNGESDSFNMDSIYEMIHERIPIPLVANPAILPPPYIIRVILIYGRSHCIPRFENLEAKKLLEASPHIFVDALYVHDPPSADNHCEAVFNSLCEVDDKGLSYVFEASRNPTKVYDCMAKLLAHPLQRPIQRDTSYRLIEKPVPNVSTPAVNQNVS